MSETNVKAFFEKAAKDQSLQTKLNALRQMKDEKALMVEVAKIAAAAGCAFTAEEFASERAKIVSKGWITKTCPTCDGAKFKMVTCTTCGGDPVASTGCSTCKGTGKEKQWCGPCQGWGWLWVWQD